MLKKTIKYTDYNGVEREEDFYFNLTKAELLEMQTSEDGGFSELIQTAIKKQDVKVVMSIFKDLILKAYGEKSADGKRFIKSKELSDEFSQTEAFSNLYIELATDEKASQEFVNGVCPAIPEAQRVEAKKQLADLQ